MGGTDSGRCMAAAEVSFLSGLLQRFKRRRQLINLAAVPSCVVCRAPSRCTHQTSEAGTPGRLPEPGGRAGVASRGRVPSMVGRTTKPAPQLVAHSLPAPRSSRSARIARIANKPEAIGAVESVKAASDIYAPLSGKIVAINEELGDQPSLLNKSPEKDGWLAKIQTEEDSQFNALMDEAAYKAHCEGQ